MIIVAGVINFTNSRPPSQEATDVHVGTGGELIWTNPAGIDAGAWRLPLGRHRRAERLNVTPGAKPIWPPPNEYVIKYCTDDNSPECSPGVSVAIPRSITDKYWSDWQSTPKI